MTQHHFDFLPPPDTASKEIQKWVEQHNQQVIAAARTASSVPGSLLSALDAREAKANAVYLLRSVLGQQLRRSLGAGGTSSFLLRKGFLQALKAEINVKKTSQDPAPTVRHVLVRTHPSR